MCCRLDWKFDFEARNIEEMILEQVPDTDVPWTMGIHYSEAVKEPIQFLIEPFGGATTQDMFAEFPLLSLRLIDALR